MTPWRRNPDGTRHRTVGRITLTVTPVRWSAMDAGEEVAGGECWDRLDGIEKADRWAHTRGNPAHRVQVAPIVKPEGPRGGPTPPEVREAVLRRPGGRCEVQAGVCTGIADHAHHCATKPRIHDPARMLAVCARCHDFIHANPAVAYERGWLERTYNAEEAQ